MPLWSHITPSFSLVDTCAATPHHDILHNTQHQCGVACLELTIMKQELIHKTQKLMALIIPIHCKCTVHFHGHGLACLVVPLGDEVVHGARLANELKDALVKASEVGVALP